MSNAAVAFQVLIFPSGHTPVEEVLYTLDTLVREGKVRYIGASNFSGWELMKSLSASDKHGYVTTSSYTS